MYKSAVERAVGIIETNKYFTLATMDDDGPWIAPLAFVALAPNRLLFVSRVTSRHGSSIRAEHRIGGAIFDSSAAFEGIDGVQFSGTCTGAEASEDLVRLFLERSADMLADPVDEEMEAFSHNAELQLYEVTITDMYVLDQKYWVEEGLDARESVPVDEVFATLEARHDTASSRR